MKEVVLQEVMQKHADKATAIAGFDAPCGMGADATISETWPRALSRQEIGGVSAEIEMTSVRRRDRGGDADA